MTQNPQKEATDSLGLANGDAMGMSNYDNAAGANRLGPLAAQGFGVHGSGFSGNFAAEGPNPYATASAAFNKADTASQSSVSNPMGLQSSPNPYAEKLAQQLAALGKYAAQDSDKPQRSSTGEDNGVSFNTRDEDHATGTDAWASLGKYVKTGQELPAIFKPNPVNNKPFFEDVGELIGGVKSLAPTSKDLGEGLGMTISKYLRGFKKPQEKAALSSWPIAAGGLAGLGLPYLLDHKPSPGAILGSMAGGTALGGLASYLRDQSGAKKQRKQLKSKKQEELTEQELRDLAVLDDLAGAEKGGMDKYVKTGQEEFVFDPNGKGRSLGPSKAREIQRAEWNRKRKTAQIGTLPDGEPVTDTLIQGQVQGQQPNPNAGYFSAARPPASFYDDSPLPQPGQRNTWIDPNFLKQQGQQPSAPTPQSTPTPPPPGGYQSGSSVPGIGYPTGTVKPGMDKYVKQAEGDAGDLLKALAILTGVGGLGGAAIGGLGSSLGGGNVGRGMISGGLTGAGLGLGASSGGIAGSAGLAAARDAKLAPSEDGLVTALGSALPPAFGAGTGAYAGHQLAQHLLGEEDEDEKQGLDTSPLEAAPAVYKEPTTGQKLKSKIEDNWPVAVGAGALGLGGYGLYKYLKRDEDDEDEKQAEFDKRRLLPLLALGGTLGGGLIGGAAGMGSEAKLTDRLTNLDNYGRVSGVAVPAAAIATLGTQMLVQNQIDKEQDEEEKEAAFAKYAMQPADQQPRHDCNAVHPDSTHEEWIREEFSNPPTRDWEREKESSWWSGARKIASTHIPLDAVKLLKEAGYEPFPCAFFGDLLNSGVSAELIPAAVEKAAGLVGAEYVTELRDSVPGLLEKLAGRWFANPKVRPKVKYENIPGGVRKVDQGLPTQLEIQKSQNLDFPAHTKGSPTEVPDLTFPKGTAEGPFTPAPLHPKPVDTGPTPAQAAAAAAPVAVKPVVPDSGVPNTPAPVKAVDTPDAPVAPDSGIPSTPEPARATVPDYGPDGSTPIDYAARRAAAAANAAAPAAPSVTPAPGKFPTKTVGVTAALSGTVAALFQPIQNAFDAMGIGATTESAELIKTFSGLPPESQKQIGDMLTNMPPEELNNLLSNPELLKAWASNDFEGIVASITPEQRAGLKEAAGADMAGFFEGLGSGEFGKTINEFTNLLGVDSLIDAVGMDSAGMNPLLKLLMVAGGALGIGGAVSGSKTAGIAGAAMFVLPLVFGALFGGAEAAVIKGPSEGTDPAEAGMDEGMVDTGPAPSTATAPPEATEPITSIIPPTANPAAPPTAKPVVPPVASPVVPPANQDDQDIQALLEGTN